MIRQDLDQLADDTKGFHKDGTPVLTEDGSAAFVVTNCDGKNVQDVQNVQSVSIHSRITGKAWDIPDLSKIHDVSIMNFVQFDQMPTICPICGSDNCWGVTRIVGYMSRITNWNPSKLGELRDRRKGNYSVGANVTIAGKDNTIQELREVVDTIAQKGKDDGCPLDVPGPALV